MLNWLKRLVIGQVPTEKPVGPMAEYNFGPRKRVLVNGAVVPPIGSIVMLGSCYVSNFGTFVSYPLHEADQYEFEGHKRWQVTDVQFTLEPSDEDSLGSIVGMTLSPHFRVFLAPVADTVNLADTLPKKEHA